jgi:hypothetical protein
VSIVHEFNKTFSWGTKTKYNKHGSPGSSPGASSSTAIRWHKASVPSAGQPAQGHVSNHHGGGLVNCSWCTSHEELARVRLGMIQKKILTRLGYSNTLPASSYKDIPKNSPLQKLIEDFSMQADSPVFGGMGSRPGDGYQADEEEEDAQIQGIYVLAQQCEPDDFLSCCSVFLNTTTLLSDEPKIRRIDLRCIGDCEINIKGQYQR